MPQPWQIGDDEERWAGYFDPHTGVLRNLVGARTPEALRAIEDPLVEARALEMRQLGIPATYDLAGLQAVHQHLFQDVYPWAGEIRTVNISKRSSNFADVADIDETISVMAQHIAATDRLRTVDDAHFHINAGYLLIGLNFGHPFREGNGRAQRAFLTALAAESDRGLAWDLLTKDINDIASALSLDEEMAPLTGIVGAIAHRLDEPPPTSLADPAHRFGDAATRRSLQIMIEIVERESGTAPTAPEAPRERSEVLDRALTLQARADTGQLTLEDAYEAAQIAQTPGPNTGSETEAAWAQDIAEDVVTASAYARAEYGYGYGYSPGRGMSMDAPAPAAFGYDDLDTPNRAL